MKVGKIEKNIEIPIGSWNCPYPLARLSVGESFLVEFEHGDSFKCLYRVQNYCLTWGKRHNRKFKTKSTENNSVRIWRIK